MNLSILRLKKGEERRLLAGHLWIYSNEIDISSTPLKSFTPGQQVVVESSQGKTLGVAYVNPQSLISARLISRDSNQVLNKALLVKRLTAALALRESLFAKPYYRLVFAEGDYLPGLIVDRFGDVLVAQLNTAGMEAVKDELVAALQELLNPKAILLRNDSNQRLLEGLEQYVVTVLSEVPDEMLVEENDAQFHTSLQQGQKTGWFYDHRLSRARMLNYVQNKKVLDAFCYTGAWGILAAKGGAQAVTCLDASQSALAYLQRNAELNNVAGLVRSLHGDAFTTLAELVREKNQYDVIVLDPPALIKKRKDLAEGIIAYQRLNEYALRLLAPNGILISASCSMHLQRDDLLNVLRKAAVKTQRAISIIEQGHQGPDHPIHPAIPETEYLKTFFARVI
jgi:23S rRNA (cytosine1962-C5)-methyltransferase